MGMWGHSVGPMQRAAEMARSWEWSEHYQVVVRGVQKGETKGKLSPEGRPIASALLRETLDQLA